MPPKAVHARSRTPAATLPEASLVRRVAWVAAAALWAFAVVALASFDVADPPSHVVAVHNDPIANLCGPVGALLAFWSYFVFGLGAWVVLGSLALLLALTVTGRLTNHLPLRGVGVLMMSASVAGVHGLLAPTFGSMGGTHSGLIGEFLVGELTRRFDVFGSLLLLAGGLAVGAVIAADQIVLALPRLGRGMLRGTWRLATGQMVSLRRLSLRPEAADQERRRRRSRARDGAIDPEAGGVGAVEPFDPEEHELDGDETEAELDTEPAPRQPLSAEELRRKIAKLPLRMTGRNKPVARDEDIPREERFEDYQFPTLDLLENPETNYSQKMEGVVRKQAQKLEEALQTYGIDGEVVSIESGPSVTLYAVQLVPGTKVSKITAVASDLARSLRAQNVRIVPNMVGRTTVGIEIPNLRREKVRLKELMSGGHAQGMILPMFLGKDSSGEPLVADLTRMPHMLIAGTTGSGKSVCMNSIIMSWLYTKRPDELKLVLVDPKMVELSQFAEIPHLMCPVVMETTRAAAILEWAVGKMEERYELLKDCHVRDVASYNKLTEEELYERLEPANDTERARIPKRLPYMVFIIDELADLIITNKEVEHSVVRIAQKARAVGIHLILATQRPQANVVTGLIKSNMPCRISFKVSSGMDSRIVLDQKGADLLLGQGDMLFLTPHTSEVRRAQGTLVDEAEIRRVARFLKKVAKPNFERSLIAIRPDAEDGVDATDERERDDLFDEAVEIMIESGRGSVSLLQRRLAIGYSRASRLVDQMHLAGIIGDHKGSVAREVLISMDEWRRMKEMAEQVEREGTLPDDEGDASEDWEDDENLVDIETIAADDEHEEALDEEDDEEVEDEDEVPDEQHV